ncbi:hypothetical protein ECB98_14490 [Brucellaceae bacterium VT-16-1752]|uniref:Uncharacterized protein n=1 Tax=Ochrobactrum teleogrylli TaxID=2479765 RepID=A0ABY2XZ01_9HYPH|nr:hypothetical protein ECB98_14490 [Brucellaceae bacterium VT-16-1752]TNV10414.1 hypothetical protein FIC94_20200 [[Ochrobactrum] teleogrylli]
MQRPVPKGEGFRSARLPPGLSPYLLSLCLRIIQRKTASHFCWKCSNPLGRIRIPAFFTIL